jgi:hypothetical protein
MGDFDQIDSERLYRHVIELQGVKHPVVSPDALNACADRIAKAMANSGLRVREQRFRVDGFDLDFRNIEGSLGPVDTEASAVLVAHYDTVATTMGANDDATGIAAMLEIARTLAALPSPPPVYFVAVSLEEENPAIWAAERKHARTLGLVDDDTNYMSWSDAKAAAKAKAAAQAAFRGGLAYGEAWQKVLAEGAETIPPALRTLFEAMLPFYEGVTTATAPGYLSRIGSHQWVRSALAEGRRIAFNITLDEIGTCSHEEGSQGKLGGIDLYPLFADSHRVDRERRIADFLLVLADANSGAVGKALMAKARSPGIDLPTAFVHTPMNFQELAKAVPMALNSDHANFWKEGIPSLFLFDSSTGRNHFCHSMADDIRAVDFDHVRGIARAVASLIADRASWPDRL